MKPNGTHDGAYIGTVYLLCRDRRLARGLKLTLADMGLVVLSEEDAARPDVALVELTDDREPRPIEGVPTVALTRRPITAEGFAAILHRPFRLDELEQTIQRCLGRPAGLLYPIAAAEPTEAVNMATSLSLTPTERALYDELRRANGAPVARGTLTELLPHGAASDAKLLNVHICTLRRKLAVQPNGARIEVVRGMGYRLVGVMATK